MIDIIIEIASALKTAAAAIAAHCDGALADDDIGFNKADTSFGRYIATIPAETWTAEQCAVVRAMLKKYKGQLAAAGIDWGALPEVRLEADLPADARKSALRQFKAQQEALDAAAEAAAWREGRKPIHECHLIRQRPLAWVEGQAVALLSPYDAALVAAIKALPSRRFDGARKLWFAGRPSAAALPGLLAQWGFLVHASVDAWLAAAPAAAPAKLDLRIDGDLIVLDAPYSADVTAAVRQVRGRRWDATKKVNTFPLSAAQDVALLAARFGWTGREALARAAEAQQAHAQAMIAASAAAEAQTDDLPLAGFGDATHRLRPFQAAGVRYARATHGRTFIGDSMGLGKTIQALATLHTEDAFPALVVCPKAVKGNWRREARTWLPGRTVAILNGGKADDAWEDADLVVVNYDVLAKWQGALVARNFRAIVLDESHYAKNRDAARTQAALLLAQGIRLDAWQAAGKDKDAQQALRKAARGIPLRLALTGTAVTNRPIELVAQLDFLGRLGDFGGFWDFVRRYCGAQQTRYGWDLTGATNLPELATRLRERCYIRRETRDVAPELPPVERIHQPVEIRDQAAYQAALADVIGWMRGRREAAEQGIDGYSVEQYRAEALVRIEALKQLVALAKLDSIVAWVEYWLESAPEASKLVLFASHREIQDALRERLAAHRPAWIRAEDSMDARDAQVARFGSDPACRVMVASLAAGGTGLNLQCADAVAFCEFGWHPAIHDQAEGRISRIGQQASRLTSYWLAADGTFDDDVIALIDAKRAIVDAINAGVNADTAAADRPLADWFEEIFGARSGA